MWLGDHAGEIVDLSLDHACLAGLPLLVGLALALPLGVIAAARPGSYALVVGSTSLIYTVPALALITLAPLVLGTTILDPLNVAAAITAYTVAVMVRAVADSLRSVPSEAVLAAEAMGIRPLRRILVVDLPLAVPAISAGLRAAAAGNVGMVSVAALIGVPQLGLLFTDGFQRSFLDPILAGLSASAVLALAFDTAISEGTRRLTPWLRTGTP